MCQSNLKQQWRNFFVTVLVISLSFLVVVAISGCHSPDVAITGCGGALQPSSPPYENTKITAALCDDGAIGMMEVPVD